MIIQPSRGDSSTLLLQRIAQGFYNQIAPVNTVAPIISGTAEVGATLTTTTGTWTNSPTSYNYRWLSSGNPIAGETQTTFVVKEAQKGTDIQSEVTAINSKGTGVAISNPIAIPDIQSLTNAQKLSLPANTPVGTEVTVSDWVAAGLAGPHQRYNGASTAANAGLDISGSGQSGLNGTFANVGTRAYLANTHKFVQIGGDGLLQWDYFNFEWRLLSFPVTSRAKFKLAFPTPLNGGAFGTCANDNSNIIFFAGNIDLSDSNYLYPGGDIFFIGIQDNPSRSAVIAKMVALSDGDCIDNGDGSATITVSLYGDGPYNLVFDVESGIVGNELQAEVVNPPYFSAFSNEASSPTNGPLDQTFTAQNSAGTVPTFTRNDVASEANWEVVL